ncbi:hypothetical protein [Neisseria sp. 74A18]|uniref:hypothetical protein n=1 Tax=Neisseria sp. 74A18 TaxID=1696094 RepID=UPI000B11E561|nr:hypothetical protein [Neisseria sp. 74A18]
MNVVGGLAATLVIENIKTVYAATKGTVFALLMVFGYMVGWGSKTILLPYRKAKVGL